MKQGDGIVHKRIFTSGEPYKCAERTAYVRATHNYNNAWTGTMPIKCNLLEL